MPNLIDTATATAARHSLLPEGAPVLVMVSGGADSVTLLRLFAQGAFGEYPLKVLHVNHMLRAADSDADEAFVRALCDELGVDCIVVRYDVAAFAESGGLNLEDAGRQVRYRFAEEELDAWCVALGSRTDSGRIAVAHTLDDRIETFFMRAIAGSGTRGLSSIAHARGRVIRPLLDCERPELREYLEQMDATWREDATNNDTDRARALVRAEILPVAEKLNPGFRSSLARTMDLLADDDALLARMALAFSRDFADVTPSEIRFNRQWMATLERTMARRTVRTALSSAFPEASRLEALHIEAIVEGLSDDAFARDLPFGLRAFSEYTTLVVTRSDDTSCRVEPTVLPIPGEADLGPCGVMTAEPADKADVVGTSHSVVISADGLGDSLTVDGVREGDRIRPFGMEGSRKLSDILIDAKIAHRRRNSIPVVRDGERIVWLAGLRMSEEYRVTPSTQRAIKLKWTEHDEAD